MMQKPQKGTLFSKKKTITASYFKDFDTPDAKSKNQGWGVFYVVVGGWGGGFGGRKKRKQLAGNWIMQSSRIFQIDW